MNSDQILRKLVSWPTISHDSNLQLIHFIADFLSQRGVSSQLIHNESGNKANLYAHIGPTGKAGIMLSGHTDVVPVSGQNWSYDPFVMHTQNGRHFGRGTADMKGFIACVLAMIVRLDQSQLETPIHLAFSYDEEIGCVGVRRLIDILQAAPVKPKFCIIGEPTLMQVAVAHKGKSACHVHCSGVESHSSLAPQGLNAIYLACDMISAIRAEQQYLIDNTEHDNEYDVPYTTLHTGVINGGTALNIVPNLCDFEFEIRNLPQDDSAKILQRLEQCASDIVAKHRDLFPTAAIQIKLHNSYPALNTATDSDVVDFVCKLTGANHLSKIAFGTEGGLFSDKLGVQTVVIGPGSIEQAHKPDEYIEASELGRCDDFLNRLVAALSR